MSSSATTPAARGVQTDLPRAPAVASTAQNWRGQLLVSHQVIVQSIGSTTTETNYAAARAVPRGYYRHNISCQRLDRTGSGQHGGEYSRGGRCRDCLHYRVRGQRWSRRRSQARADGTIRRAQQRTRIPVQGNIRRCGPPRAAHAAPAMGEAWCRRPGNLPPSKCSSNSGLSMNEPFGSIIPRTSQDWLRSSHATT